MGYRACVFVFLYFAFSWGNELVERTPGDEIWAKCVNFTQTIGMFSINIPNACIKLTEATDCGVTVNLKIANKQILDQQLDLTPASRVCGDYSIDQGFPVSCNICVAVQDDPNNANQQCVSAQPTCSAPGIPNIPLQIFNAGCFSNDKLANIEQCRNNECPAPNGQTCSNHGTCNSGTCQCYNSWFGGDCSVNSQLFEKCVRVDQLSGDVCTRLIFGDCSVKLVMVVVAGPIELPLYSKDIPVKSLGTVFRQDICTQDTAGCHVCLRWNDLELTNSVAHGCGTLSFVCQGFNVRSYPLGCFNDDKVIPLCFGTCPNDCSGRGDCVKGACQCTAGWTGDDCSKTQGSNSCPKGCSGKGVCSKGTCICQLGSYGADCSDVASSGRPSFNPAFVIIPLLLLIIGGAVAAGGVWYYKKRSQKPKFSQFDLLEQDENSVSLTQEETDR